MSTGPSDVVGDIADEPAPHPVQARLRRFDGAKWSVVTDDVQLDADTRVLRDVVLHPGAVGIGALDAAERVVLVRQYRHPVAARLWEIPAGLLDDPTEAPWQTAMRELLEETGLRAERWDTLLDLYASPGMSSETLRVFLARGLSEVPVTDRPPLADEERHMVVARVPLHELVEQIGRGAVHNALAVAGILAAAEARRRDWQGLLPLDHPWPGPHWGVE